MRCCTRETVSQTYLLFVAHDLRQNNRQGVLDSVLPYVVVSDTGMGQGFDDIGQDLATNKQIVLIDHRFHESM